MPNIFITGDKHGEKGIYEDLSPDRFPAGVVLGKGDYLVILGDFGLFWHNPRILDEELCIEHLSGKPWTTLVVDGNHENFDLLDVLPTETRYGAPVGMMAPNVHHLRRGYVYDIGGLSCFVFGGGHSVDKNLRTPGESWWYRENASREETERGYDSLDAVGWRVDHVFSHVAPTRSLDHVKNHYALEHTERDFLYGDPTSEYLDTIAGRLVFNTWAFGHYHVESRPFKANSSGLFRCEYKSVKALEMEPELRRTLEDEERIWRLVDEEKRRMSGASDAEPVFPVGGW